jgi:hypothetical protein
MSQKYWSLFISNKKGIQNYLRSNYFQIQPMTVAEKPPCMEKGKLIHFHDTEVNSIEREFKGEYDDSRHMP